jgi:hypothetical protein
MCTSWSPNNICFKIDLVLHFRPPIHNQTNAEEWMWQLLNNVANKLQRYFLRITTARHKSQFIRRNQTTNANAYGDRYKSKVHYTSSLDCGAKPISPFTSASARPTSPFICPTATSPAASPSSPSTTLSIPSSSSGARAAGSACTARRTAARRSRGRRAPACTARSRRPAPRAGRPGRSCAPARTPRAGPWRRSSAPLAPRRTGPRCRRRGARNPWPSRGSPTRCWQASPRCWTRRTRPRSPQSSCTCTHVFIVQHI